MKVFKKLMVLAMATVMTATCASALAACSGTTDGSFEGGDYKPSADGTTVQFWGYGDEAEVEVFGRIVDEFNATVGKENKITVKYTAQPASSYSSQASTALASTKTPDVVYVEDSLVKSWAANEYIAQLDIKDDEGNYVYPGIEEMFLADGKIWEQGIQRYRYDVENATVTDTAALWALPKDIGPTVIYYNKNYIEALGVTIISVPAD